MPENRWSYQAFAQPRYLGRDESSPLHFVRKCIFCFRAYGKAGNLAQPDSPDFWTAS